MCIILYANLFGNDLTLLLSNMFVIMADHNRLHYKQIKIINTFFTHIVVKCDRGACNSNNI
jgi:hypothetical protein